MKRNVLALLTALTLAIGLQIPALGAQDFGLVYDETELLDSEYIRTLAYDTFQGMTNDYEAQFRLDVVMELEEGEALPVAQSFYEQYEYGDGDDKAGVLLLLGLDPDDTGLTFREYAVLPMGYAAQVVTGQTMIELEQLLDTYFNDEMWSADLETDQRVFETAMPISWTPSSWPVIPTPWPRRRSPWSLPRRPTPGRRRRSLRQPMSGTRRICSCRRRKRL